MIPIGSILRGSKAEVKGKYVIDTPYNHSWHDLDIY